MGLDMYLKARAYYSAYNFEDDDKKDEFNRLVTALNLSQFVDSASPDAAVEFTIGYWRKANAIHGWFIKNCADGDEDASGMSVSRDKLKELRETCIKVMDEKPEVVMPATSLVRSIDSTSPEAIENFIRETAILEAHNREFNKPDASDPLPPVSGFFFGSTEKDERYYLQIAQTIAIIDKCLSLPGNFYFGYEASW